MSPRLGPRCGPQFAQETIGVTLERSTTMSANLNDPKQISELGEEIYARRYKAEYEGKYPNKYIAVNISDETVTLGDTASAALAEARKKQPHGFFHLIRVGHPSAFQVGLAYRNVVAPSRLHR